MKYALLLLAITPLACASNATAAPTAPAPAAPAPAAPAPAAPAPAAPAPAAPAPAAPAPAPAPSAPAAPVAASCKPSGSVLFEIDHRVVPGASLTTSETKVFSNGAWTHDATDADGKPLAPTAGCLAKADFSQLETAVKDAPWNSTIARGHCMAVASTFTVYQVNGREVFKQKLCNERILDPKSRAALDLAVAMVEGAVKH